MIIQEETGEKITSRLQSLIAQVKWANIGIGIFVIIFWGSVAFIGYRWMAGEVIFPFGCHIGWTGEHCHMFWDLEHAH
ncbi:MAG: hypothetical protein AAGD96_33390 [Chloroflexota bacterium]